MSRADPVSAPALDFSPLAKRLASVGQSHAWAIADEALQRVAKGEDLILLTLGDPVCDPHPAITQAAVQALQKGRTHYTPLLGDVHLREAIAAYEGVSPARVLITPGAQHGAFAVLSLLAGPGDEVILCDPYYATYPGVIAASGAKPVPVPAKPDLSFDVEAMARAITPATKVILLNSPANPTGAALTEHDYARLRELAVAHDLWLVCDEVYARFGFGQTPARALQHGPTDRTIVLNSFSKSHAMTGFRVGWIVAPESFAATYGDWQAAALFGVSQFVQDAALAAIRLPDAELADYYAGFERRARQVVARVAAIPGLSCRMPAGSMFIMLDCRGVDADDVRFARRLLDEAGVAVVPGSGFGEVGRGHVRLSLTGSAEMLDEAFDRIAKLLA